MRGQIGRRLGKGGGPGSLGGKLMPCRICGMATKYRHAESSTALGLVNCGSDACRAASKALRYARTSETRRTNIASGKVPVLRDNWRLSSQVAKEEDTINQWMTDRGWTPQHKVLTGVHSFREPRYYKLDFAHLERLLCVEIDGASHRLPGRKERDLRKDAFLRDRGWNVLRITTSVIREDTDGALVAIAEFMRANHLGHETMVLKNIPQSEATSF